MRHAGPAVILLLLLVPLLPSAGADHAYSHRYVVFARVVDAEDRPVPNVSVTFDMTTEVEGNCGNQPGNETAHFGRTVTRNVSDANGFVIFCKHVHALDRTAAHTVTLAADDAMTIFPVDAETRVDYATLVVSAPGTPSAANGTVLVGRAWQPTSGKILVDHIDVYGDTLKREDVSAGDEVAVTNNYGDFAVLVPAAPETVTVRGASYAVVAEHGWAHVKARLPQLEPDITLLAHVEDGACWWSTPDAPTGRNPNVTVPAGRPATLLADPRNMTVTLRVGDGELPFLAGDDAIVITLGEPTGRAIGYACVPGGVPAGRITWGAQPPPANVTTTPSGATTTTPTGGATTTTPIATSKPAPLPLALTAGALVAGALLLRRKRL